MTLIKTVKCGICGREIEVVGKNFPSVKVDFSLKLKGAKDLPSEVSLDGWKVKKDTKVVFLPEYFFTLNGTGYRVYLVCGRPRRKKDCFYQIFKLAPLYYGVPQLFNFPPHKILPKGF